MFFRIEDMKKWRIDILTLKKALLVLLVCLCSIIGFNKNAEALIPQIGLGVAVATGDVEVNEDKMKEWVKEDASELEKTTAAMVNTEGKGFFGKIKAAGIRQTGKAIRKIAGYEKPGCLDLPKIVDDYKQNCPSCGVIKLLTESFMGAADKAQPMMTSAGTIFLLIGSAIWLGLFAIKSVSAFTTQEPSDIVNSLLTFLFKAFVALAFINYGMSAVKQYFVEPVLEAGADYGILILQSTDELYQIEFDVDDDLTDKEREEYGEKMSPEIFREKLDIDKYIENEKEKKDDEDKRAIYEGKEVISSRTINKIFMVNKAMSDKVSENMILGSAIVCYANSPAGRWVDSLIEIPNLYLMICGGIMWGIGFFLTLAVAYYLVDIPFKLGFGLVALPVTIALWPFEITKDKLSKNISIILKAAAVFAFLSITISLAMALIYAAMGDTAMILKAAYTGEADYISSVFDLTGTRFLLMLFAYVYALKLISGTISNYVNKFFPDGAFGSTTPIHENMVAAGDYAKRMGAAVGNQAIKATKGAARLTVNSMIGDEEGGTTIAGNAVKAAGGMVGGIGEIVGGIGRAPARFRDSKAAKAIGIKPKKKQANNILTKLGNKIEGTGDKVIDGGKTMNQTYRNAKTAVKTAGTSIGNTFRKTPKVEKTTTEIRQGENIAGVDGKTNHVNAQKYEAKQNTDNNNIAEQNGKTEQKQPLKKNKADYANQEKAKNVKREKSALHKFVTGEDEEQNVGEYAMENEGEYVEAEVEINKDNEEANINNKAEEKTENTDNSSEEEKN